MKHENVNIAGVGSALPKRFYNNVDLPGATTESAQWVEDNLGIKSRGITRQPMVDMAYMASLRTIEGSDLEMNMLDMVIVSTSSASHHAPSISSQLIEKLGIECPAVDINAVCSGFVYGLDMACRYLAQGDITDVLVVAVEQYSSITDNNSRDNVYFGDGAGAVWLYRGNGTIYTNIYADGKSDNAFRCRTGGTYEMVGRKVYDRALEKLPKMIYHALNEASLSIPKIDYMIPHQASIRVIRDLSEEVGMPMDRVVTVMDKYANIASASIPIAMAEVDINDKTLLLVTIGSGWTYGTAIIQP